MSNTIEIETSDIEVETSKVVEITTGAAVVEVNTATTKIAELIPNHYVLSSGGMYSAGFSGSDIPIWLQNAIQNEIETGTLSLSQLVGDLQILINSIQNGVNQSVLQLQNEDVRLDGLITTVKTTSDNAVAAIYDEMSTKITATQASAQTTQILTAQFNTPESAANSWFLSNVSTVADAANAATTAVDLLYSTVTDPQTGLQAQAEATGLLYTSVGINPDGTMNSSAGYLRDLQASVGQVSASLTTTENVVAGYFDEWMSGDTPQIGMYKFIGDTQYYYLGGTLGEANDGWVRTDYASGQTAEQAATWAAGASSLITAPDGSVTGWSYGDGSGVQSEFKVSADNFVIQGSSGIIDYDNSNIDVPTKVSDLTNDLGYVRPDGVATAINNNTTTINGSKITTGTLEVGKITSGLASITGGTFGFGQGTTVAGYGAIGGFTTTTSSKFGLIAASTSGNQAALAAGIIGTNWAAGFYNNPSSLTAPFRTSAFMAGGTTAGYFSSATQGAVAICSGSYGLEVSNNVYMSSNLTVVGTISNFTGSHYAITDTTCNIGDIMCVVDVMSINVNETYSRILTTENPMNKRVFGVISYISKDSIRDVEDLIYTIDTEISKSGEIAYKLKPEYEPIMELMQTGRYTIVKCNALGEGMINVCSENGNIESGDYICSSSMPGKGMRQDDDLLHNYTVAKALEAVDWSKEPSNIKMIACTYHCG